MKKFFTLAAIALMATCVRAGVVTMDMEDLRNPEVVTYDDNWKWSETYNDDAAYKWLQYGDFYLSHLYGGYGSSYGGYYWDGFVPALGGDDTDFGLDEAGNVGSGDWVNNAWGCMAGGGVKVEDGEIVTNGDGTAEADPNAPYIVGYWGYWGYGEQTNQVLYVSGDEMTFEPVGVYVCNAPWAYYGTLHGDGFARAFAEGDSFVLHAFGVHEDGTETETTFNLVEYTDGELIAANEWTFFDLSTLGKVVSVYFTITSTDASSYGNNTSSMFCMDKFQVKGDDTGLQTLNEERQVSGVRYYNLAGQEVDEAHGVTIVVTTYSDGTTSTAKVIK